MFIDWDLATRLGKSTARCCALIIPWSIAPLGPLLVLTLLFPLAASAEKVQQQPPANLLSVEDAIATAVEANPSLSQMQARYEALTEVPSQLGTLPDPVLSLNALNLPTDTFRVGQENMTQMQIGISQVFPFPGKLALKEGASKYEALAAGNSVDEVRLLLIRNVRSSWWQLHFLDRSLQIIDSNQDLLRQFIEIAKTKYEVGEGLQQDVLLAQLELSKLFDQKIKLQAIRRNQAIQLNVLMDTPPYRAIVLPGKVTMDMPDIIDENNLYEQAESVRPLLKQKENDINAAEARLKLARKEYYPDFKLGGTLSSPASAEP